VVHIVHRRGVTACSENDDNKEHAAASRMTLIHLVVVGVVEVEIPRVRKPDVVRTALNAWAVRRRWVHVLASNRVCSAACGNSG
jgi:hypothetical protein